MRISQIRKTAFGAFIKVSDLDKNSYTTAISPTNLPKRKDKELQEAFQQIGNALTGEKETIIIKSEPTRRRFSLRAKIQRRLPSDLVATVKSNGIELVRLPRKWDSSNWSDLVIKTAKVITERYGPLHFAMKGVAKK